MSHYSKQIVFIILYSSVDSTYYSNNQLKNYSCHVLLIFLFFYGNDNGLGKSFGVAVMYMITRNVVLVLGVAALLARIFKLVKENSHLFYIITGTINFCVGILCIALYFLHQADMPWLNKCLLNLLAGFLIIADTFFLDPRVNSGTEA